MVPYACDYCGTRASQKKSQYAKTKHHFCNRKCYSLFRAEILPRDEQNAWQGGVDAAESARRWRAKNGKKMEAMNRARRERELGAPGHHTRKQWLYVRDTIYKGKCAEEDETCKGSITKDHKVPLTMGGSNDPDNLEPLCRSHNSRKGVRVRVGQEHS